MIIYYTVFEIWQVTDVIVVFHFGQFFSFYPLTAQKINISKKWKKHLEVHHFTHAYQKLWLYDVGFLRYVCDRQTEGWKKWHIEVGAPPKNFITWKYQVMTYYKNLITSTLLEIGPKIFSVRGYRNKNFLPFPLTFLRTSKNSFPGIW